MHTRDTILTLINGNDIAVVRAIKTITSSVGWTSNEANFALSLLDQITTWERTPPKNRQYDFPLSSRQLAAGRNLVSKYAAVLARIANDKAKPAPKPVVAEEVIDW